jgi:hypothetical protein
MKQKQFELGERRLAAVAEKWGVTTDQAARILHGKEYREFWKWVNADESLNTMLWGPVEEDLSIRCGDNGYGVITEHDLD